MKKNLSLLVVGLLSTVLPSCGGDSSAIVDGSGKTPDAVGVTQGGAQDIARVRSLIEAGEVPSAESISELGFLAEHAFDQPAPTCGQSVCPHPMLAVAPRFDGTDWTMGFISLNTAVEPALRERTPVHVVVALEYSSYTLETLGNGAALDALVSSLTNLDRVSLVVFEQHAELLELGTAPDEASLGTTFRALPVPASPEESGVDLYAGLATAYEAIQALSDFSGAGKIVLFTSGHADAGVSSHERLLGLADAVLETGTSISVVGLGEPFVDGLPQELGRVTSFAYAEDGSDLESIARLEGSSALLPIATDFELTFSAGEAYETGLVYGARSYEATPKAVTFRSPALFIGTRTSAHDVSGGRRGGGGGFFVELRADQGISFEIGPNQPAFSIAMRYTNVDTGARVEIMESVTNPMTPGEPPEGLWPYLSAPDYAKPFMALNMFLALRATLAFYEAGDCARALGIVQMMRPGIKLWQDEFHDPDIDADAALLEKLGDNIEARCELTAIEPIDFEGGCFGI
jgi:Ca-activated chloride channel family protein